MRRCAAVLAVLFCTVALARAAAGRTSPPEGSDGTTTDSQTIEITFSGDTVEPERRAGRGQGRRADQPPGQGRRAGRAARALQPRAGVPYGAGTTTLKLTIDEPGVVEVESHELEKVIVQLEVS